MKIGQNVFYLNDDLQIKEGKISLISNGYKINNNWYNKDSVFNTYLELRNYLGVKLDNLEKQQAKIWNAINSFIPPATKI